MEEAGVSRGIGRGGCPPQQRCSQTPGGAPSGCLAAPGEPCRGKGASRYHSSVGRAQPALPSCLGKGTEGCEDPAGSARSTLCHGSATTCVSQPAPTVPGRCCAHAGGTTVLGSGHGQVTPEQLLLPSPCTAAVG